MQAPVDWVQIFFGIQFIKKQRPVLPVFPDYLSVSYDYEETNQTCPSLKISQSTLYKAHVIEMTKACIVPFMKSRNSLIVSCREKEKTEDGENVFFKALAKVFLLISKSCS